MENVLKIYAIYWLFLLLLYSECEHKAIAVSKQGEET